MSDLAASGGYYISCAADKIYANSTTITGSIGVFGMIPNMGGAFEKHLGITFDEVATHSHAGKPDGMFAMNKFEIDAYNESIEGIYEDFTSKVAIGRGMTPEQVEEVARGRVWTGEDALEVGLVDELGNLDDAIKYAVSLIDTEDPEIVYYLSSSIRSSNSCKTLLVLKRVFRQWMFLVQIAKLSRKYFQFTECLNQAISTKLVCHTQL